MPHVLAEISWSLGVSVLTVVLLVGAAIIILLSRRREDVNTTLTANVSALDGLNKTLEKKLKAAEEEAAEQKERADKLEEKNKALESELKTASLEYGQLALLDVAEWLKADKLKRTNELLLEEVRDLTEQVRRFEREQLAEEIRTKDRRLLNSQNAPEGS